MSITQKLESIELSVIVPVFNEAENIEILCSKIIDSVSKTHLPFEVIFVDDGSIDGTVGCLKALGEKEQVRYIRHRGNFGQSAALATGFRYAKGSLVATLDGDGQNDPEDFPGMLEHLMRTGADCVTGVRRKRRDNLVKRISSRIANGFRNVVTGDRVSDSGCGIRVVRSRCLAEIPVFNGMHRFLPTLLRAQGYRIEEMEVNHKARMKGISKYGVNDRLWRGLRDCFAVRWYKNRAFLAQRVKTSEKE